jgi:SAM-dependent methyltransferase
LRSRVLADNERYLRRLAPGSAENQATRRAAEATVYRDRGLSSDASLRIGFAIEQAMAALRDRGELRPRSVRRVAIVGPGLDVVDKAQGYDFYPVQTIQPFAVADSLRRLGLGARPAVTALDISPRVIAHLRSARERGRRGDPYRLTAVLERDRPGLHVDPALVEYWRRVGSHIGTDVALEVPGAHAGMIRGRAVDVRPDVVLEVTGAHLNIVFQRLDAAAQLDLAVATNVLVYYEPFEQALAVSNIGSMLRTGGLLVTNQPVPLPGACGLSSVLIVAVAFQRAETPAGPHDRGDSIYVYRKV